MNERRKQTNDLLDLAMMLGPEGEDLDLTDLDMTIDEVVEISNTLGRLRKAGEVVKRSLAQYWHETAEGVAVEYGESNYYLGYDSKKVFIEGQQRAFTEWVMKQDIEVVEKIIGPAYKIPTTPLGRPGSPVRETFFDEERTSSDLRIQSKPTR